MTTNARSRRLRQRCTTAITSVALALSALVVVETSSVTPAAAVVPPLLNTAPQQVSADPLPTVQINGVVWDQEIVGNTVYVVGNFSQARPAGAPAGSNQTARGNVLAYNLTTGALIPGFVANTNNQVKTVTASPDGSRIYIGGQFTSVNGTTRYRIAALNPTTGAVITGFNAIAGSTVKDLVATNTTVYAGGIFASAGGGGGQVRNKLAAFSATNGALTAWAPSASANVETMLLTPDGSKLIVGGIFLQLNGQSAYGMGALDPATGALLPWAANQVVKNGGSYDGAILHLFTEGTHVYGNGFTFGRASGNLEGVFKADPDTGEIVWVEDCHGDTYQAAEMNGYVYTASHTHFCGNVGGFPQSSDEHTDWGEYQRHNLSFKDEVAGTIRRDNWSYHNLEGLPAPSLTTWFPEWNPGTFTGQGQAAWAVEGNGQFISYAGEFTRINTTNQQGIVRFAVRGSAPNDSGPRLTGDSFPVNVVSETAGQVRISFPPNFDRDDGVLTYDITRNGATIHTVSVQSTYYDQPAVSFVDTNVTPGQSYTYRVRAEDPWGNAQLSNQYPITVATSGAPTTYANRVLADGPALYWRLGDDPGTLTAEDAAGVQTGRVNAMTFGRPGAIVGDPDTSVSPTGTTSRVVQPDLVNRQGLLEAQAARDDLTVEAWFRTTSTQGGRILGFGSSDSGNSSSERNDRVLYVSNQGRVLFGVRTRAEGTGNTSSRVRRTIQSPAGLNDGDWHHVVGTLSSTGMRLYVDGEQVDTRSDVNSGHGYYGYWRVGADTLSGWTSQPSSTRLNGDIDEAAVYYRPLDAAAIQSHWNLSGHGSGNSAPLAEFAATVDGLEVDFDSSASEDFDGTIVSYLWDFGDGDTSTQPSPTHVYDAGGTYDVTLTVTDDGGLSSSVEHPVTLAAANVAPTAAFTADATDLDVDFDASSSDDPDGTIASYEWDFDDGSTATGGPTTSHTYAAAGTYDVTLTVTDDDGAPDSVTVPVVVTEPGAPAVFAADSFERSTVGSFGTADLGGTWTNSGSTGANYTTSGGAGRHRMASAGGQLASYLNGMSAQDVLATVDVGWDKVADPSVYATLAVRNNGSSDYRVRIRTFSTKTTLTLYRRVNNAETSLGLVTLPTLVYGAGDTFRLQLRATGSGTTTLEAKVWRVGDAEPAGWQITRTDSTASLQGAGGIGLVAYLSGAATNAPVVSIWDNLLVTEP